jgi:hypothetical protein
MNRDEALRLGQLLLKPAGALGYLVTRGSAWPPMAECGEYKRAVGLVMGNAYRLLQPLWDEHPDLDPGSELNRDPVGSRNLEHPPETSPAGLLPYLEHVEEAVDPVMTCMLADALIATHRTFITDSAKQLQEAIGKAKKMFASRKQS